MNGSDGQDTLDAIERLEKRGFKVTEPYLRVDGLDVTTEPFQYIDLRSNPELKDILEELREIRKVLERFESGVADRI